MGKHEKIHFNYSAYFNFIYSCKQCGLSYPQDELKKGICFVCREENKFLNDTLNNISLINDRIKLKKMQQYNKQKHLTK